MGLGLSTELLLRGEGVDVLHETVLESDAVKDSIDEAGLADGAAESNGGHGLVVKTVRVNVADVELDGTTVLGADDAVSGRALTGNVRGHN